MGDLLKTAVGKFAYLVAWLLAAAITLGAAAIWLLPLAFQLGLMRPVQSLDRTAQTLLLIAVVILAAFTLAAIQTPLYRVLEGYVWFYPRWLKRRLQLRHIHRRNSLQSKRDELVAAKLLLDAGLKAEELARYPVAEDQIAPTKLGNAIRALEDYGWDRFKLSVTVFWAELISVAPSNLITEIDSAKAAVDFFVSTWYLTAGYGLASLALAVGEWHFWSGGGHFDLFLVIEGAAVMVLGPWASYRFAVTATSYWAATVRALVNIGRVPLAQQLGLCLPYSLHDERRMWEALLRRVVKPVTEGDEDFERVLEGYRLDACSAAINLQKEAVSDAETRS